MNPKLYKLPLKISAHANNLVYEANGHYLCAFPKPEQAADFVEHMNQFVPKPPTRTKELWTIWIPNEERFYMGGPGIAVWSSESDVLSFLATRQRLLENGWQVVRYDTLPVE